MAQKAAFIKIPVAESGIPQTMPTEPEARIRKEDIEIQRCTEEDAPKIVEGLYTAFPEAWWSKMEPPEMRPTQAIREERLTKRILPSFKLPHVHWIKAVHLPTGTIAGVAGWQGPVSWLPNVLNHASAADFYGWKGGVWTQEEFDEMWAGTDIGAWDGSMKKGDDVRREILAGEKHWYLAPLFTWPEWQGKGVGKRLLDWAIEQADATEPVTPMYLESAPYARAVYMHVGFKPVGDSNFLRRGPAIVKGLEADEEVETKTADEKVAVVVDQVETSNEVV